MNIEMVTSSNLLLLCERVIYFTQLSEYLLGGEVECPFKGPLVNELLFWADAVLKAHMSHQLMSDTSIYVFTKPTYIEMDQYVICSADDQFWEVDKSLENVFASYSLNLIHYYIFDLTFMLL